MTEKKYDSVTDMVRDIVGDDFASELEERVSSRTVVKNLLALRTKKGLSQSNIAEKLGRSQSSVSKLENGTDASIRLGDLGDYLDALGCNMTIVASDQGQTLVQRVRWHAMAIKHIMDEMTGLAQGDADIQKAVACFFGETFFNLVNILQGTAAKLPRNPDGTSPVRFVVEQVPCCDSEEEECTCEARVTA